MLGWEFPPALSGGLGVATYGVVKALRTKASIRLIVPHSDPSSLLQHVDIIGLNNMRARELQLEHLHFNLETILEEVQRIPLALSPYHHINIQLRKQKEEKEKEPISETGKEEKIRAIFSDKEVYGSTILKKVYLFAELAGQLAMQNEFDVIHAHDWVTYPAALKIKRYTNKPLVLHVHALETDRAGESARNDIYWLEKNALDRADKILAVSHYTKQQMVRHYDISETKIRVVYNGIETKQTIHKEHKLKEKIVVFLGRITKQKGPLFLLETASKVVKVYPKVKFLVAGTGDQFANLLETTAYQKLGSKFIFAGFLSKEKVDEVLAMADVYFMPSVSEPFGLSALEAAQHFVPGVLSKQSGAAEVITSSLKADFWDTDKYANYIYALLTYNSLHDEIARRSHEELNSFTWEHAAEKILATYNELVSGDLADSEPTTI